MFADPHGRALLEDSHVQDGRQLVSRRYQAVHVHGPIHGSDYRWGISSMLAVVQYVTKPNFADASREVTTSETL